jgi:DNA-binding NarL/FixJ family response regulator
MIRIILVDDHALVREGLSRLLEAQPDMKVVGSFGEPGSAVRFAVREGADVAIVEIALAQANGIDVTRQLRDASPETSVLVLSMHAHPAYVHQALLAGALGYVAKESAASMLLEAVRTVRAARRYLCNAVGHETLQRYLNGAERRDPVGLLSTREREVLRLTVEGSTIAQTAQRLGISPKSIETYRSRVMTKLGLEHLPALVKFAIRHGITSVE